MSKQAICPILSASIPQLFHPIWSKTAKNKNWSTGPLARPFARSLAPLTRSLAHFAHSLARGKGNFWCLKLTWFCPIVQWWKIGRSRKERRRRRKPHELFISVLMTIQLKLLEEDLLFTNRGLSYLFFTSVCRINCDCQSICRHLCLSDCLSFLFCLWRLRSLFLSLTLSPFLGKCKSRAI